MAQRVQILKRAVVPQEPSVQFLTSGGTILDLILGGGWGLGRVANIVGDKSSGKTLLAIEACANFARAFSTQIAYRETEAAFDLPYARSMGMPSCVDWGNPEEPLRTVEDLERDLTAWLDKQSAKTPSLYIVDSLDALSSEAELKREVGEGTYGQEKPKAMSKMFRALIRTIEHKNCCVLIVSQIRDKIGVTFGETKTRSGGRALDFYSSQVVWLSELKKISRVHTGVTRVVGVEVLARNKKNKLGRAYRQGEFSILFNYGVDDEQSMLDWLKKNKGEHMLPEGNKWYREARRNRERETVEGVRAELRNAVVARWEEIEDALAPSMSKYE